MSKFHWACAICLVTFIFIATENVPTRLVKGDTTWAQHEEVKWHCRYTDIEKKIEDESPICRTQCWPSLQFWVYSSRKMMAAWRQLFLLLVYFSLIHSFKRLCEALSIKTMYGLESALGDVWCICYQKTNIVCGMTDLWTDCLFLGIILSLM